MVFVGRGRRTTENDALCGEVVRLAASCGMRALLNARMIELVEHAPSRPQPQPQPLSPGGMVAAPDL